MKKILILGVFLALSACQSSKTETKEKEDLSDVQNPVTDYVDGLQSNASKAEDAAAAHNKAVEERQKQYDQIND